MRLVGWLVLALLVGCSSDGSVGDGDCPFGDDYLPFELGNQWRYAAVRLEDGIAVGKTQALSETLVTSVDFPGLEFIEQVTTKQRLSAVSLFRVEGDRILRYRQEDFDSVTGESVRVTIYDPPKLRFDSGRLDEGTMFDESYTKIITNDAGSRSESFVDRWEVISEAVPCEAALGRFECVHIRVTRTAGGLVEKDFFWARGVGKVSELGGKRREEIADCSDGPL